MISDAQAAIFQSLGVELLETNRYEPPALVKADVRRTFYFLRNRREFRELEERYSHLLNGASPGRDSLKSAPTVQAELPELVVRHIGGLLGHGLFAHSALSPGDLVGEYFGLVRVAQPGSALPDGGYTSDYAWGFPKVRSLGKSLEIDARTAGGILRFANHSGMPNAEPDHFAVDGQWRIVFVATQSISAGEEITVDYGEAYWSGGERELLE